MLEISNKTNLLEQNIYKYSLQDVEETNLYREMFDYEEVPKIAFNHRRVPMNMPTDIWITDTSFRDGMQSMAPYTVKQRVDLFKYLARLGGPYGIIRQSEFFIYTKQDQEAIEKCMELGYKFPAITTWIRAKKEDFKKAGIEYTIKQIDKYRALGVEGIHLYALNKWKDVSEIIKESGMRTLV